MFFIPHFRSVLPHLMFDTFLECFLCHIFFQFIPSCVWHTFKILFYLFTVEHHPFRHAKAECLRFVQRGRWRLHRSDELAVYCSVSHLFAGPEFHHSGSSSWSSSCSVIPSVPSSMSTRLSWSVLIIPTSRFL